MTRDSTLPNRTFLHTKSGVKYVIRANIKDVLTVLGWTVEEHYAVLEASNSK